MPMVDQVKLSDEFLKQYEGKQPKWGFDGLGFIVYLRTYARKKEDGTLENWQETVKRYTEGNFKIEAQRLNEIGQLNVMSLNKLITEMERLYHLCFNLVMTPPGRGMWMSGTEYAEKVGDAENNCWGVSMQPNEYDMNDGIVSPFSSEGKKMVSFPSVFAFDQAMKGGGVGVTVQSKYVDKIPMVNNEVNLRFICDENHPDYYKELEPLNVIKSPTDYDEIFDELELFEGIRFDTPDSRQGWAMALALVIDAHYEGAENIDIDLSKIRERGTDIKGFGGEASGPAPLVQMLQRVNEILNNRVGQFVTRTEWGDVIQNIGCCVVAGNVRRTAIILIGDKDDQEYIESKNYSLDKNRVASQWRWASNNSVDIDEFTSRENLREVGVNIYFNGEPGYINVDLARNYGRIIDGFVKDIDGEVVVFNPCGEIPLPDGSPCNLFEINLPRVHELIEAGIESESLYEEVAYLSARYAYRVTFRPYEWAITRNVVQRHRRLGVGITGITDWALMKFGEKAIIGYYESGGPILNVEMCDSLDKLYTFVKEANIEHAKELKSNPSIKVTTVKPSGTVSILMGVSPGQHYHWSKYMCRRIRMSTNAPLVPILIECGYYMEPAVKGYDDDGNKVYDYNTVVVEFPVKAPTANHDLFQSAGDVPLKEQAALQALLATYWSDNAVSATLSFHKAPKKPVFFEDGTMLLDKFGKPELKVDKRDEDRIIDEITDILDRYKTTIKSTSLLPYATDTYDQMPYESISEARYEEMIAKIKAKPWEVINGSIEAEEGEIEDSVECVGGSCPIK